VKELFEPQHYPDLRQPAPLVSRGDGCGSSGWRRRAWTWQCRRLLRGSCRQVLPLRHPLRRRPVAQDVDADNKARRQRRPAGAPETPYDVTGWTLPMQMGVETIAIGEPVSDATRGSLKKLTSVEAIRGKVDGAGPVYAFSHNTKCVDPRRERHP